MARAPLLDERLSSLLSKDTLPLASQSEAPPPNTIYPRIRSHLQYRTAARDGTITGQSLCLMSLVDMVCSTPACRGQTVLSCAQYNIVRTTLGSLRWHHAQWPLNPTFVLGGPFVNYFQIRGRLIFDCNKYTTTHPLSRFTAVQRSTRCGSNADAV